MKFTKMHGLGNDYIYVDVTKTPLPNPSHLSEIWSDRHKGIGADGLVLIGNSMKADFSMRIFNADGSEAKMCGNASRCIGKYVYDHHLTRKKEISLETLSGIKTLRLSTDHEDKVVSVQVDMGVASLLPVEGECFEMKGIEAAGRLFTGTAVSMGNPHLVLFVDNMAQTDIVAAGSELEHSPLFPDRVNVEFAQVLSRNEIRMRVWERGSGITQACGTGACATAVASAMAGKTDDTDCRIVMDGGALAVSWNRTTGHVFMTGDATEVFSGEIQIEL